MQAGLPLRTIVMQTRQIQVDSRLQTGGGLSVNSSVSISRRSCLTWLSAQPNWWIVSSFASRTLLHNHASAVCRCARLRDPGQHLEATLSDYQHRGPPVVLMQSICQPRVVLLCQVIDSVLSISIIIIISSDQGLSNHPVGRE